MAAWPAAGPRDLAAEARFERVIEIVRAVRNARAESKVEPARWIEALVVAGDGAAHLEEVRGVLSALAHIDPARLTIVPAAPAPGQALALVVGEMIVYLPLAGLVDLAAERARLEKELEAEQ